jgi:hypothetical protein
MNAEIVLEDTFSYKGANFVITVRRKPAFQNVKNGRKRDSNVFGDPKGFDRTPRDWKQCDALVASLRLYKTKGGTIPEWARARSSVTTRHRRIALLETSVKRSGLLTFGYTTEDVADPPTAQETAQAAIDALQDSYNEWSEPAELDESKAISE